MSSTLDFLTFVNATGRAYAAKAKCKRSTREVPFEKLGKLSRIKML